MATETTTKTVLLHDGPFDETDRFLLRAPATDYIENLHFHQNGSLQKRAGNELLTTVADAAIPPEGDPFFLYSVKNTLHTLAENGAYSYINGAWTSTNVPGFLGTKNMYLETPPVDGMGHIDVFGAEREGNYYQTVVFEVRERSTTSNADGVPVTVPKHVVVQSYDADGNFLFQKRIENARSPKVIAAANANTRAAGLPHVFYQDTATGFITGVFWFPNLGTLASQDTSDIQPSDLFGMESISSKTNQRLTWRTKLGAGSEGNAKYHICTDEVNDIYHIIWQTNGDVNAAVMDENLARTEGTRGLFTATGPGAGTEMGEAFDVHCYDGNAYYLWSDFNTTDPFFLARTVLTRLNSTLDLGWEQLVSNGIKDTFTHGGIASDPINDRIAWMVHESGLSQYKPVNPYWDEHVVRDPNSAIRYNTMPASTGVSEGGVKRCLHHRMATRPIYDDGKLYCAIQQWTDMTHYAKVPFTYNGYAQVWGAIKPRTTVLACFDYDNNRIQPVAYFDAAKSKTDEYVSTEVVVHTPHISIVDGAFMVPNRLVIFAEDASCWIGEFAVDSVRLTDANAPAQASLRIHRVFKGKSQNATMQSVQFGDGILVSTAIPLWYDGKFFGEVSPLDSPEIIWVKDERLEVLGELVPQGFNPGFEAGSGTWRRLHVILGYSDSSGNKHRSAPSTAYWVNGFDEGNGRADALFSEGWVGKDVTVYYTWPLSLLPADLEYFVELYASDGETDDPRLVDASTIDLHAAPTTGDDVKIETTLLRWAGYANSDPQFLNPSRTSRTIYNAEGELDATPWPAFTRAAVTSTRMFALDAVNKGKVLVSKRFADFVAPEYNAQLDINLGDERDLLCIGKMDDKTVIFEADDIHIIYGDGPLNNGKGEDFAVQYISTDVGCQDQESIVECPAGLVFFRKERGFYLLDRQLNIKFIGDRVYNLTKGLTVLAAELVSADGHIRFLCDVGVPQQDTDGRDPTSGYVSPPRPVYGNKTPSFAVALIWNYEKDQWTVFSNYRGVASAIYDGNYTQLLSDWSVWTERLVTDWKYQDPVGTNRTLLRTTWIPLAQNTQGYSRLDRINVLGRYMSALARVETDPDIIDGSDIQVKIWYDYEEGVHVAPQVKTFSYRDFGFDVFSDRHIRAERLQFTITPEEGRGRCQAIKLEFEEILPTSWEGETYVLGQGFEISSIDFEIGIDDRVTRLLPRAVLK